MCCVCVQLEEVKWRLNLQIAQSSRTKMKLPNALFEFDIQDVEVYTQAQYAIYSGTSLIRTPMGQKKVSLLVRCPLVERVVFG